MESLVEPNPTHIYDSPGFHLGPTTDSWLPRPLGCHKLNFDGSHNPFTKDSGYWWNHLWFIWSDGGKIFR